MDTKFKKLVAETFEMNIDDVEDNFALDPEGNWDSIAHLSIISGIDYIYNVQIRGDDLVECRNISDIYLLIKKNGS